MLETPHQVTHLRKSLFKFKVSRKSDFILAFQSIHIISFFFIDGAIDVNLFGKRYSHKLPEVVNVKYLSFADFTGNKNVFYFNCPDDCGGSSNNCSANNNPPAGSSSNELSPTEVPPNSSSNEVFPPKVPFNSVSQEESAPNSGSSTELPSSESSSTEAFSDSIPSNGNSTSDNVNNNNNNNNAESEQNKTFWQRFWGKIKSWFN